MKPTTGNSAAITHQETYVRIRDNPFFNGMRRGEAAVNKNKTFQFHEQKALVKDISEPASDIGDRKSNDVRTTTDEDIVLETINQIGKWSKTSSPLIVLESDLVDIEIEKSDESPKVSTDEAVENFPYPSLAELEKTYNVRNKQTDLSDVPLPPSAALFYCGPSPKAQVVEVCESVCKINIFLRAKRHEVNAGVSGKFLHAVTGPCSSDVGSVVSTIMYAYYLHETLKSNTLCTVPVVNMKRSVLDSHADLQWLLDSCCIDTSALIFIDEIDLSYYDLFGSLKLVLVNCDKIPSDQEALRDAIVEVFGCTESDDSYSSVDNITVREDASCCTVIAEKFSTTTIQTLGEQGFSRLLLGGILMDTRNLSSSQCTTKDKYMATLLINGAGRYGCNGIYQILRYKGSQTSDLKVEDILQKEFKKWTSSDKPNTGSSSRSSTATDVGMSSIGMSISQFLSRDSSSTKKMLRFQRSEKVGLLIVVSGYYDLQKKFRREILISAETAEYMENVVEFLRRTASSRLPLKAVPQQGLRDNMRVFEVEQVTSRKTVERLLEKFCSGS